MTNYATKHNRADMVLTRNLGDGAYSSRHVGSNGNHPPEVYSEIQAQASRKADPSDGDFPFP